MTWELKTLKELGFVGRGKSRHRPRGDEKLYGGEHPFIQTGDIAGTEFYITTHSKTYSHFGLAQSKLWKKGTLCISIVGANTGESAILDFDACFPDSVIGFIADPQKSNTAFVKYYLDTVKTYMKNISEGAARENLSMDKLLTIKIPTPPIEIQNKISSILSSYDKLANINDQRIHLLEEIAEEIYKEWFVRIRFPGYQDTAFFDKNGKEVEFGTKGALPKKWRLVDFKEIVENYDNKRKPLSKMERTKRQGKFPYYGAAKIIDFIDDFIYNGKYLLIAEDGSVITPKGYPVLQLTNSKFWVSNHAHVIQGKDEISTEYIYLSLCRYPIQRFITGAAQPKINQENLNRIKLLKPDIKISKKFNDLIIPFFEEIRTLKEKNEILQQTRDLLLPRLISGKLDVAQLSESELTE